MSFIASEILLRIIIFISTSILIEIVDKPQITEKKLIDEIYTDAIKLRQYFQTSTHVMQNDRATSTLESKKIFKDRVALIADILKFSPIAQHTKNLLIPYIAHDIRDFYNDDYQKLQTICANIKNITPQDIIKHSRDIQQNTTDYSSCMTFVLEKMLPSPAYHELGHAYVAIQESNISNLAFVSIEHRRYNDPTTIFPLVQGGCIQLTAQADRYNFLSSLSRAACQSMIATCYAGGIAESFNHNKIDCIKDVMFNAVRKTQACLSKNFYNFSDEELRIQSFYRKRSVRSDIQEIKSLSAAYCQAVLLPQALNTATVDENQIKDEIKTMLRQCFNQSYMILQQHKDNIEKTVPILKTHKIISGDIVYKQAGIKRPKFFYEKTDYIRSHRKDQEFFDILATPQAIKAQAVMRGCLARQKHKKMKEEEQVALKAIESQLPRPYNQIRSRKQHSSQEAEGK
jgi:hypothetical protein